MWLCCMGLFVFERFIVQRNGNRMRTNLAAAAFQTVAMVDRKNSRAQIQLRLVRIVDAGNRTRQDRALPGYRCHRARLK